jgi:hypothetical protein
VNIFVLSLDPKEAAQAQVDKHVVKMPLETAQLLCSPFEQGDAPYRRTHYNHPSAVWARQSPENYQWLVTHGVALCDEYALRYGKQHKSRAVIDWAGQNVTRLAFQTTGLTPFAQAMPDEYKNPDPVLAYRAYYLGAKARIATWKLPATPPAWWQETTHG